MSATAAVARAIMTATFIVASESFVECFKTVRMGNWWSGRSEWRSWPLMAYVLDVGKRKDAKRSVREIWPQHPCGLSLHQASVREEHT